jgi:hypothetical protein
MVAGEPHDGGERRSGASNSTKVKRQSIEPAYFGAHLICSRQALFNVRMVRFSRATQQQQCAATLSARESSTCIDAVDYEAEWCELADFELFSKLVCIGRIICL